MTTLQEYIAEVQGKTILNGQCWGLGEDYYQKVLGGTDMPTNGGSHPGYVLSEWENYGNNGLEKNLSKQPANSTAVPGSFAYWNWGSKTAPLSHIAVVLADEGSSLKVLSQNTNGHQYAEVTNLPKEGLLGYLVPGGNATSTWNGDSGGDGSFDPNATPAANTGNPVIDWVLNTMKTTSNGNQIGKVLTSLFLPATWVRVVAGYIGFMLIIAGLIFIVMDYRKTAQSGE